MLIETQLDWIGDANLQCAVFNAPNAPNDYTIFSASDNGILRVAGPGWKECLGLDKCKYQRRRESLNCKCSRRLEWQLENQEQAMRLAAKIVEHLYSEPNR